MIQRYLDDVVTLELDVGKCVGCGMCTQVCPHGVLRLEAGKATITDRDLCMECGACASNCPTGAFTVQSGVGCVSGLMSLWWRRGRPTDSGGCCC